VVMSERSVFYRERSSQMYGPTSYSIGMFVSELPYIVAQGVIFTCIAYPMINFPMNSSGFEIKEFLLFLLIFIMHLQMTTYFGQLLACVIPTAAAANILGSLIHTIWTIYCGFIIVYEAIPEYYIFLYWLSPIKYSLEALVVSQFYCDGCAETKDGVESAWYSLECADGHCLKLSPCESSCTITTMTATTSEGIPYEVPIFASDYATYKFGMERTSMWRNIFVIGIFCAGFRGLTTLALAYINHQKR